MLSSSLHEFFKLSKTTSPQKLFAYDCVTLYRLSLFVSAITKQKVTHFNLMNTNVKHMNKSDRFWEVRSSLFMNLF